MPAACLLICQLLSSGSDGLIKLWTIRTNECESTIDAHDDKIWALDLSPCGTALFSGGADSKIAYYHDTTVERDNVAKEAEEQNILLEQNLSNHLRHKQYEKALEIALELEKPYQVLKVRLVLFDAQHSTAMLTVLLQYSIRSIRYLRRSSRKTRRTAGASRRFKSM